MLLVMFEELQKPSIGLQIGVVMTKFQCLGNSIDQQSTMEMAEMQERCYESRLHKSIMKLQ